MSYRTRSFRRRKRAKARRRARRIRSYRISRGGIRL